MKQIRTSAACILTVVLLTGCANSKEVIQVTIPDTMFTESALTITEMSYSMDILESETECTVVQPTVCMTEVPSPIVQTQETKPAVEKPSQPESTCETVEMPETRIPVTETEQEIPSTEALVPEPPTSPAIDIAALEAYARSYAQSLGFTIDYSLGQGNGGYYPALDYPIQTMEEGYRVVCGCVSSLKEQLIASDSTGEFAPYRYNCKIEYLYSDEYGDWYLFWDFYG